MEHNFSQRKIAKMLIETMDKSRIDYDRNKETLLSDTPEYFITVNAFNRINKEYSSVDDLDITMEWNVKNALEEIVKKYNNGRRKPGRPAKGMREDGRFDLALWHKNLLYGFVEVKKIKHEKVKYMSDLTRIRAVLKEARNYKKRVNGFFAFYLERSDNKNGKPAEKKILEYVKDMRRYMENFFKDEFNFQIISGKPSRYLGENKNLVYQPFCVVVTIRDVSLK
jgi:hypothetical protein